ncbi:type IV secretion system protein VirB2 [Pantoea ananatis]|uniref:TrbC/VirB2 family protein n=1 Tax=Pantoea ananas TaxID=553 RepID=UPI00278887B3|nr:TrbC/VirB2 family protein [Pantoea ananatis]MDQ1228449.1 type IV secretion system protein VirB2 [Pantoea ananatis]
MKLIKTFVKTRPVQTALATLATTSLSMPASAADGFTKANSLMENVSTGLYSLAAATITVATLIVGYKVLYNKQALSDCSNIIIGGIIIASASAAGGFFTS